MDPTVNAFNVVYIYDFEKPNLPLAPFGTKYNAWFERRPQREDYCDMDFDVCSILPRFFLGSIPEPQVVL